MISRMESKLKEMEIIEWMVSIKLIEVMEPMELNVYELIELLDLFDSIE